VSETAAPARLADLTDGWCAQGVAVHIHADWSCVFHTHELIDVPAATLELCITAMVTRRQEDINGAALALLFGSTGVLRKCVRGANPGARFFFYAEGPASASLIKSGARVARTAAARPLLLKLERAQELYVSSHAPPAKDCLGDAKDVIELMSV